MNLLPQIKYYPVGNGDTSLITLSDGTTILVDCNIRESAKGEEDKTKFDVKADLLNVLKYRGEMPFVDVFILSHGDMDHCRGFSKNFYQGDPKKYSDKNIENKEILMDVIWFSPMALESTTNDEEEAFKKEAKRRIKLHNDDSADKNLAGNRIIIIGYNGKEALEELHLVRKVPGEIITKFNEKEQSTFSVFIHAPFKDQLKSSEKDKNYTSIVFQARFKNSPSDADYSCLAMFGGDADHYAWEKIISKTKESGKDKSESALQWDLYLSTHHCSWSFFNDTPQEDNSDPKKHSLEFLDYKRDNSAKIVASCKEILDNTDNPPHFKAKSQYVKKVTSDNFLHTEKYNVVSDTPQPIIFEISKDGPVFPGEKSSSVKSNASEGFAPKAQWTW